MDPTADGTREQAQGDEWLDAYCWRCGSSEAVPDVDGRRLCAPCRREEIELPSPSLGGFRFTGRIEWESHALERCWRCMTAQVDPQDDLGLCQGCRSIGDEPAA
jgi:hypothetical protein